jgi:capsular polysaccharide biosynthesis protein
MKKEILMLIWVQIMMKIKKINEVKLMHQHLKIRFIKNKEIKNNSMMIFLSRKVNQKTLEMIVNFAKHEDKLHNRNFKIIMQINYLWKMMAIHSWQIFCNISN